MVRGVTAAMSRWRQYYTRAETEGEETIDGQPCYRVVMTPVEGNPETVFLSKQDGWIIKYKMTYLIRGQNVLVNLSMNDYRSFGGILLPGKLIQKSADIDWIGTMDSVEVNPVIPRNRFNLPADVLAISNRRTK